MKKAYFALAVLAMAALAGCRSTEMEYENYTAKKGEVVFRLANSNTRSAEAAAVKGVTIPLGDDGSGNQLFLEETITRLDDISYESFNPATRGTPAYTENFADLYGDFKAAAFKSNSGSFESSAFDDGVFEKVGTALWKRAYGDDVQDKFPLYFFLRSPYDLEGTAVKDLTYNTTNGSITFNYDGSTLTTASAQKDLLFTSRLVTEDEYDNLVKKSSSNPTGVPVLFHHALTGIKFANFFSNPDEDLVVKTYITKVEITGLKDGGKCVITPRKEYEDNYNDNKTGDYSSKTVAVWSNLTSGTNVVYSQSFTENDTIYEIDFEENGSFGDNGTYAGTSFDDAATANNLNKADGSLTFWFVPQQLTENVKMTVEYKVVNTANNNVYNGKDENILFGNLTRKQTKDDDGTITYGAYANWQAGELRTYTLKAQYVDVILTDKMSADGFEKDQVKVTNNGNVKEYVRVNIIANWMGNVQIDDGVYSDVNTVLMGYESETSNKMTNPWNDKDFDKDGNWASYLQAMDYEAYGTFSNLPSMGTKTAGGTTSHGWIRHDKYYYYTQPLGPNESISNTLFDSYEIGVSPEFWIADVWGIRRKAKNVHLEMDVVVQAIPAPTDAAGNLIGNYESAWREALGVDNINDLP